MLSFKQLSEKKTKIKINPKKEDVMEKKTDGLKKNHGEDCDCMKCEQKRRREDVDDGPDVANEENLNELNKGEVTKDTKYHKMSYKAFKKTHKDFKSKGEPGKTLPRVTTLDKKTQATVSRPVKFVPEEENKNCGCGKTPCETYGVKEGKEIPANVKKIAKELDKAVAMHKSQAQRLRKAGVSEMHNTCPEGQYYCHDMKKCKPIPEGKKVNKDGMLVNEAKYEAGASTYGKATIRNKRKFGTSGELPDPMTGKKITKDATRGELISKRREEHKAKRGMKEGVYTGPNKDERKQIKKLDNKDYAARLAAYEKNMDPKKRQALRDKATKGMKFTHESEVYWSSEALDQLDAINKREKAFKRFVECWKTHKKVGMKMKGGKLVNDCRPKNEEVELDEKINLKNKSSQYARSTKEVDTAMTDHVNRTKGRHYGKDGRVTEVGRYRRPSKREARNELISMNKESTENLVKMLKKEAYKFSTNIYKEQQQKVYASKEEVSEESSQKVNESSILTFNEVTRFKKETGYVKGGTKKPTAPKQKDTALDLVKKSITDKYGKGAIMSGGSRQQKKVKGEKDTRGTGKFKKAADQKKQTAADAKKRGFKSSQDYVNTMARYGGKDNYDKGRGLGT